MNVKRRTATIWMAVLAFLALVGLVQMVLSRNFTALLPLVVLALIFGLYRMSPAGRAGRAARPRVKPGRAASAPSAGRPRQASTAKPRSRKASPFRVIEGGKDEDGMPKYH